MLVNKVRFDGQTFLLDPSQDVEQTKREIVAAVREGSDFVEFHTVGHGVISLLVTPTLPVRFEVIERSAEQLEAFEINPLPFDETAWLDYGV
ncbi:hypothetical protein [Microbacterium yannicii]|uniref:hypothetical protein n=1 Tax=Microbacterium yannicii TaxID=671622 RepID=UPI0002EBF4B8|nr:hypothetical protein [Microbacterium yannicii]